MQIEELERRKLGKTTITTISTDMAVAEQRRRPVITGTEAASLAIRTLPIENSSSLIDALMASLICRYVARWLALCDIPRLSSPLRRQCCPSSPLSVIHYGRRSAVRLPDELSTTSGAFLQHVYTTHC